MQIRKNTKAFKTILEIVATCQTRPDREKLIRLYITKAGHTVNDRINVEGIQGEAGFFYDMTFETVLSNLQSSNHQLIVSDDIPGIYFFHSTSNKIWDEAPFEFDEAILKEFSSLPELPVVRKKGKAEKYVIPTTPAPKSHTPAPAKKKAVAARASSTADKGPRQPDFKLRHEIHFTNLEKIIFRQAKLDKEAVLGYYDKIADHLLPYLKDRVLWTRRDADALKPSLSMTADALLPANEEDVPDWIRRSSSGDSKHKKEVLLCNSKEDLLWFVENGSVEFDHSLARVKTERSPDYLVIAIDSPDFEVAKAIEVALAAREIFDGLKLRSLVKTDGISGLHVYFPLETGSSYENSRLASEYICKLIRLKIPRLVSLNDTNEHTYGKVSLNYSINTADKGIVAPYSLVPGQLAAVATPLLWDEITEGLRFEEFNHESIFRRLKQVGDPFESIRKKNDADELVERLEANYSFLF
jgi:bifunctional non-homologous end joining protein LigD